MKGNILPSTSQTRRNSPHKGTLFWIRLWSKSRDAGYILARRPCSSLLQREILTHSCIVLLGPGNLPLLGDDDVLLLRDLLLCVVESYHPCPWAGQHFPNNPSIQICSKRSWLLKSSIKARRIWDDTSSGKWWEIPWSWNLNLLNETKHEGRFRRDQLSLPCIAVSRCTRWN